MREVGTHRVGEEAEVARLGWVLRVHEKVTVLVVFVAGGGVDSEEFLGSWVSCNEDGFHLLVCLPLPAIFRKFFALGSAGLSNTGESLRAHVDLLGHEICIINRNHVPLVTDWRKTVGRRVWNECFRDMAKFAERIVQNVTSLFRS